MDQITFLRPISKLRLLQIYYHSCHNLCKGPTFISDHSLFGDLYPQLEANYDSLVEFMIATIDNESLDTTAILKYCIQELESIDISSMSTEEMLDKALEIEAELYSDLEVLDEKGSIGLKNLVGDLATQADIRKYKIQQRLK